MIRSWIAVAATAMAVVVCGPASAPARLSARPVTRAEATGPSATPPCREVVPAGRGPITWWSPPGQGSSREMARWCQTIGPVLFQPAAARAGGRAINRLVVVSWNVHVGAGDVDGLIARLRAGEFTDGEPIGDFVLLLQEAYRRDEAIPTRLERGSPVPSRIAGGRDRAPEIGHFGVGDNLAVLYAPSMRNGIVDLPREDRGNAIVSTLPLAHPTVIELPLERQRRAAIASSVEGATPDGRPWRVRLVDVHLDTALALTRGGPFAARRRQADALVAGVRATAASPDGATIVAGDFNTWGRRERALDAVRGAFPQAAESSPLPTWVGPFGIHATLDHVFASGLRAIAVHRLPDRFGSDHYPLLAVVRF